MPAKSGNSKSAPPPQHRSADTGKYVTEKFAKEHPKTTVKESSPKPKK